MSFSERDKAAAFNYHYFELLTEFENRAFGYVPKKDVFIRELLCKTYQLSYLAPPQAQETCPDWEKGLPDLRYYGTGGAWSEEEKPLDQMVHNICEDCADTVLIEEFYHVKGLHLKRYLPLMTSFLLVHGGSAAGEYGLRFLARLHFIAFWLYRLDEDKDVRSTQGKYINEMLTNIVRERERDGICSISVTASDIVDEYFRKLNTIFPRFVEIHSAKLDAERMSLKNQIIWLMNENGDLARSGTNEGGVIL